MFASRQSEADRFYRDLLPEASEEDQRILRQASAGMIWSKQFFHYDVARWLDGDHFPPPDGRKWGRNRTWRHLKAADILSMPDKWEYPWFAAWDLAYHTAALSLVDVDFAKDQIELVLKENYLHPNGQIPAYEWAFGDVNPPVHAMGALKAFRAERVQRGQGDLHFLERVFHKLLLNYAWWINRKDSDGNNVFEGGFLGLDNISVFDRSHPLPAGYALKQADATGWMAMFALNMTVIALELAAEDHDYEAIAIQIYQQFLAIAHTIAGHTGNEVPLWDPEAGFFKDLMICPDGQTQRIDVYSWVGLIPAVRLRGGGSTLIGQDAPFPRGAAPTSPRRVRRQRHLPMPGLGKRPGRASAVAGHQSNAAAHPQAAAARGRIPVAARRAQRQPSPRHPQGPGNAARRRRGPDRVRARRVQLRPVRRQFQLARPDLAADQLHAGAGAGEIPPLPRRQFHHRRALSGQPGTER